MPDEPDNTSPAPPAPPYDYGASQAELQSAIAAQRGTFDAAVNALQSLQLGRDAFLASHSLQESLAYQQSIADAQVAVDHARIALDQAAAAAQAQADAKLDAARRARYDEVMATVGRMRAIYGQSYPLLALGIRDLFHAVDQVNQDVAGVNGALPSGASPLPDVDAGYPLLRAGTQLPGIDSSAPVWPEPRRVNYEPIGKFE